MAKISVIVPVYKVEPYLRKCVDSVLGQTFRDFELILIDDGSPDLCGKICDEYAMRDTRVKVIHQANGGLSAARNAGIDWAFANSKSEFLAFIDSDDWVDEDYLERLVEGIGLGADMACTSLARVYESGAIDKGFPDRGWKLLSSEKYWLRVDGAKDVAVAKLYSKELFSDIRYPVGKINEDMFATFRAVFRAKKVAVRDIPTYKYLKRPNSITSSADYVRNLSVVEAMECQLRYFSDNDYKDAAEYSRGRVLAWKLYAANGLRRLDAAKSKVLRAQVADALRSSTFHFWLNRDVYRQVAPWAFKARWPFAMIWNFVTCGRESWLMRELVPILRTMYLERREARFVTV